MARSSLSGFLLGTVVAFGGVAVISVTQTLNAPAPEAANVNLPAGSGFDGAREDRAAALPGSDPVDAPSEAERATAPAADDASGIAGVDTAPAEQPETGDASAGLSAPEVAAGDLPSGSLGGDTSPRAEAPSLPSASTDAPVTAVPSRPVNPDVGDAPEMAALPDSAETAPSVPTGEADQPVAGTPSAPVADTPEAAPEAASPLPEAEVGAVTAAPQPVDAGAAPDLPAAGTDDKPATTIGRPEISDDREPAVIVAIPQEEAPKRPALPKVGEAVSDAPRIGKPATRLTEREDPAQPGRSEAGDAAAVPEATATEDLPPLQAFAAPFDNPDNKPLMSIVLLDRGTSDIGVEALSAFPYPLTFAVDVTSPEALARMARYRKAGFEVMALTDIPEGATGGDTETLLRAGLRELPEVVAVMEGDQSGLQSGKAISDQVSAVLQETGHGVVFFAQGLNTAQKLAVKNGVAAAAVFRDFDSKGQSATVIRRFLDGAAFKARQQPEGVVMVGRLQPETISALLLWGLQDRATRVALAPISAVLNGAQN